MVTKPWGRVVTLGVVLLTIVLPGSRADSGGTSDNVLSEHLKSIGSPEARNSVKSRVVEGGATYRVLVGGSGAIDGKAVFVSEGQKSHVLLKINANGFNGEQFVVNDGKSSVAGTYSDKSRSEFGEFVRAQDVILREGLLGGVWSTGWPLLDLDGRNAKVTSEGSRKVDGKEYRVLRYHPKKSTDLEIMMYFDPATLHHIMTTYRASIRAGLGMSETESAQQQETRYRIEERFSDFTTVDGLTLPRHYDLRFTEELQNGFTKTIEWEVAATRILNNVPLDPKNFEVK